MRTSTLTFLAAAATGLLAFAAAQSCGDSDVQVEDPVTIADLTASGGVQLDTSALPDCTAELEAHVRYSAADSTLVVCSSLSWIALDSTPLAAEGEPEEEGF